MEDLAQDVKPSRLKVHVKSRTRRQEPSTKRFRKETFTQSRRQQQQKSLQDELDEYYYDIA